MYASFLWWAVEQDPVGLPLTKNGLGANVSWPAMREK